MPFKYKKSNDLFISVRIESDTNPDRVIVDKNGYLPELNKSEGPYNTFEVFQRIGASTIASVLKPASVVESELNSYIVYRSMPVSDDIVPIEPYRWAEDFRNASEVE